jgi:hypothetical protein
MNELFGVWLCGPTDCFLHAVFTDRAKALRWLHEQPRSPEGGYVRAVTDSELVTWRSDD